MQHLVGLDPRQGLDDELDGHNLSGDGSHHELGRDELGEQVGLHGLVGPGRGGRGRVRVLAHQAGGEEGEAHPAEVHKSDQGSGAFEVLQLDGGCVSGPGE